MSRVEANYSNEEAAPKKKKKKKGKGLLIIIIILALLVGAGGYYTLGTGAVDPGNEEIVVVEIPTGTGAYGILNLLDEAGLIKNMTCAKIHVKLGGYNSLQANTYEFNKGMSLPQIMKAINTGDFDYISKKSIVINDGLRLEQVASSMAEQLDLNADEIMAKWSDKSYVKELINDYWFLTDDVLNKDVMYPLEGYLYADTYFLTTQDPSIDDLTRMCLDRMDTELTARKDQIKASGFSIHDFLSLTSIVTKEARAGDQAAVAGVFMNRLEKGMSLGSDVTVCYIFQEDRVDLKVSQLESESPYNLRKFTGLTPGPICAVIGDAMDAVLNYEKSDYLYFFADSEGKVHYFKNDAEFNEGLNTIEMLSDSDEEEDEEEAQG